MESESELWWEIRVEKADEKCGLGGGVGPGLRLMAGGWENGERGSWEWDRQGGRPGSWLMAGEGEGAEDENGECLQSSMQLLSSR